MVSALVSINEVNLCRARLVLRWVTVSGVQSPMPENLSQYITSHPGQLSLAIPPWVGVMSTSQRAVMPCGWKVKAGMVREWVAGKLCNPLAITGHIWALQQWVHPIIGRYISVWLLTYYYSYLFSRHSSVILKLLLVSYRTEILICTFKCNISQMNIL